MKTANHNKDGSLAHSQDCNMVFGRKDAECPRCIELINGAAPRAGWQKDYFEKKAYNEKIDSLSRATHKIDCSICNGNAQGVCTFGEW